MLFRQCGKDVHPFGHRLDGWFRLAHGGPIGAVAENSKKLNSSDSDEVDLGLARKPL